MTEIDKQIKAIITEKGKSTLKLADRFITTKFFNGFDGENRIGQPCEKCHKRVSTEVVLNSDGWKNYHEDVWCRICSLEESIANCETSIRSAKEAEELLPKFQEELKLLLEKEVK